MIDKEEILTKLKEIDDPELHVSIVELGLIYNINITPKNDVEILMTLTTPGCPLTAYFADMITNKVKELSDVRNVEIKVTFDPPWDSSKIQSEELKMELGLV